MEWIRGRTIGHGASAAVSTATSTGSGDIFAAKSVQLSLSKFLQREQKLLSALDSPHIVGYRGCDITVENGKTMFNLMIEYAPKGSLADEIRRQGGKLDESTISFYTRQIVEGLNYLHSNRVVHCDIKGSNILLSEDGVKIADFGCAKAEEEAVIGGTPMFMAPEVARGEEQGCPADIWALGCTIIEMSTGNSPWPNMASTLQRIAFSGEFPMFPEILSMETKDFLSKCLRVDPKERWTAKQLLKHPFLNNEFHSSNVKKVRDFNITASPTSILDHQEIWSSTEEATNDVINHSNFLNSPEQRIKHLSMNSPPRVNWELWQESWMTVRQTRHLG